MLYMPAFLKRCSICEQWYPPTRQFFYSSRTGLRAECKACVRSMRRARYQVDPQPQRQLTRRYYAAHVEECRQKERDRRKTEAYRERDRQRRSRERDKRRVREQQRRDRDREGYRKNQREYRAANRERVREQQRQWRRDHIDLARERGRRWARNNPDKHYAAYLRSKAKNPEMYRRSDRKRRARKCNAPGEHTAADVNRQYEVQQGLCYWCSSALHGLYHVDHIIPLSRGGSNWPDNLACTCARCNQSKGNKLPYVEWQPPHPLFLPASNID